MSLDLLKERFGHSVNKKQADNKEKIQSCDQEGVESLFSISDSTAKLVDLESI